MERCPGLRMEGQVIWVTGANGGAGVGGAGRENWAEGAKVGHEAPGRPVREF